MRVSEAALQWSILFNNLQHDFFASDKLLNMKAWTSPFRIYWSMHIITLVLSIVITIIYWTILYDGN